MIEDISRLRPLIRRIRPPPSVQLPDDPIDEVLLFPGLGAVGATFFVEPSKDLLQTIDRVVLDVVS